MNLSQPNLMALINRMNVLEVLILDLMIKLFYNQNFSFKILKNFRFKLKMSKY